MDPLHVHLYINHLPIFGTFLGLLVLILALWRKSRQIEVAAYFLFIISAVGVAIAYLTGEGAEHAIKNIPGIVKDTIERHEEFSIYPLILLIILGVASIVGLILIQNKSRWVKKWSYSILTLSIVSFALIAWTGYLGGQIRHTEINSAAVGSSLNEAHGNGSPGVQLNNGAKWQSDTPTNQAMEDLMAMVSSSENGTNSLQLKDKMTARINQLFKECTLKGEEDEQLHNYLIPLINKIGSLGTNPEENFNTKKEDILSYLNTYKNYFD